MDYCHHLFTPCVAAGLLAIMPVAQIGTTHASTNTIAALSETFSACLQHAQAGEDMEALRRSLSEMVTTFAAVPFHATTNATLISDRSLVMFTYAAFIGDVTAWERTAKGGQTDNPVLSRCRSLMRAYPLASSPLFEERASMALFLSHAWNVDSTATVSIVRETLQRLPKDGQERLPFVALLAEVGESDAKDETERMPPALQGEARRLGSMIRVWTKKMRR